MRIRKIKIGAGVLVRIRNCWGDWLTPCKQIAIVDVLPGNCGLYDNSVAQHSETVKMSTDKDKSKVHKLALKGKS